MIDLSGAMLKLDRANQQRDALLVEIAAIGDREPLTFFHEVNADASQYTFYFVEPEPAVPFADWALIVGECLFNYRCALDHLVYAMAVAESGTDPPPGERYLMFPICRDGAAYSKTKWRIKTLCAECQALIKGLQPNKRLGENNPLQWLEDLHTSDKHRLLTLCYYAPIHAAVGFDGCVPGSQYTIWYAVVLEPGAPALQVTYDRPNPDVTMDLDFDIQIAINQGSDPKTGMRGAIHLILPSIESEIRNVFSTIANGFPH